MSNAKYILSKMKFLLLNVEGGGGRGGRGNGQREEIFLQRPSSLPLFDVVL